MCIGLGILEMIQKYYFTFQIIPILQKRIQDIKWGIYDELYPESKKKKGNMVK